MRCLPDRRRHQEADLPTDHAVRVHALDFFTGFVDKDKAQILIQHADHIR